MKRKRPTILDIICKVTVPMTFCLLIVVHLWAAGWDGRGFR